MPLLVSGKEKLCGIRPLLHKTKKNGSSLFIHRNMTYQILTYNAAQREKKQTRKYSLAFCVDREASSSGLLQFAEHTGY